jgi:type II restriction enzyme
VKSGSYMNLQLDATYAIGYKSACQIARKVTEGWAKDNLHCVACSASSVTPELANSEAIDFRCKKCSAAYQLKASKSWSERRIPDAGYDAMMRALRSDSIPNLLVMQYSADWFVFNLMLIPSFFFTPAAIEKRKPLGLNARRAGWVGCNILLSEIAVDGKIRIVSQGIPVPLNTVRSQYEHVRPFSEVHIKLRGWTLDVLRMIRRIGHLRFSLDDIYAYEEALAKIYPSNRNIKPKIRQQLQVLRDLGYLIFEGRGRYELID